MKWKVKTLDENGSELVTEYEASNEREAILAAKADNIHPIEVCCPALERLRNRRRRHRSKSVFIVMIFAVACTIVLLLQYLPEREQERPTAQRPLASHVVQKPAPAPPSTPSITADPGLVQQTPRSVPEDAIVLARFTTTGAYTVAKMDAQGGFRTYTLTHLSGCQFIVAFSNESVLLMGNMPETRDEADITLSAASRFLTLASPPNMPVASLATKMKQSLLSPNTAITLFYYNGVVGSVQYRTGGGIAFGLHYR